MRIVLRVIVCVLVAGYGLVTTTHAQAWLGFLPGSHHVTGDLVGDTARYVFAHDEAAVGEEGRASEEHSHEQSDHPAHVVSLQVQETSPAAPGFALPAVELRIVSLPFTNELPQLVSLHRSAVAPPVPLSALPGQHDAERAARTVVLLV